LADVRFAAPAIYPAQIRSKCLDIFTKCFPKRAECNQREGSSGAAGFDVAKGFASNGYDAHSPGHYSLVTCFIMEVVMTMMFLFIIMGATHGKAPAGFAPLAIGLALVMIHLVSIPVTNTSVNPARSTGPALFVGGWALSQLWLFWVAPLIGGALGGLIYRWLSDEPAGVVEGRKQG
jgi:aquaporin Z